MASRNLLLSLLLIMSSQWIAPLVRLQKSGVAVAFNFNSRRRLSVPSVASSSLLSAIKKKASQEDKSLSNSYSIDDLNNQERPYLTFDSQLEDEGYGAADYIPGEEADDNPEPLGLFNAVPVEEKSYDSSNSITYFTENNNPPLGLSPPSVAPNEADDDSIDFWSHHLNNVQKDVTEDAKVDNRNDNLEDDKERTTRVNARTGDSKEPWNTVSVEGKSYASSKSISYFTEDNNPPLGLSPPSVAPNEVDDDSIDFWSHHLNNVQKDVTEDVKVDNRNDNLKDDEERTTRVNARTGDSKEPWKTAPLDVDTKADPSAIDTKENKNSSPEDYRPSAKKPEKRQQQPPKSSFPSVLQSTSSPQQQAAPSKRMMTNFPSISEPVVRPAIDEDIPPTHFHPARAPPSEATNPGRALPGNTGVGGTRTDDEVYELELKLKKLQEEIYTLHGKEFNLNSPKQVALALFGDSTKSTNKSELEGMAASSKIADLILQYRHAKARHNKLKTRLENKEKGTLVQSVSKIVPKASKPSMANPEISSDPLLLVDTSAYIFRAYYSMPPLHRADGMPVGAVMGFCNMLNRLVLNRMLDGECPRLVLVLDAPGPTFRNEMYPLYKANRAEAPMDLIPQFQLIREAATAYGIVQLEAPGYEADDVIATLCDMAANQVNNLNVHILSGDKDLMQLITTSDDEDKTGGFVQMIDPMTMNRIDHDAVIEKWGVSAEKLGDLLALAGDTADNIPGVPGIGPKIAATLIQEYGSLDNLLDNLDSIKQKARKQKLVDFQEQARLSRRLVELERKVPLEKITFPDGNLVGDVSDIRMEPIDPDRIIKFYDDMGFYTLKERLKSRLDSVNSKRTPVASEKTNSKSNSSKGGRKFSPRKVAGIPNPEDFKDVPF
jgi:5'-3' exonuclease